MSDELVAKIAGILEGYFWDEDAWAGTDAAQRARFREAAEDVLAALNVTAALPEKTKPLENG